MALKDIDYKKFLLQKGERVGLWIAASIMVLLVAVGSYSAVKSASPTETATGIVKKADDIQNRIKTGLGNPDLEKIRLDLLRKVEADLLDPSKFPCLTDSFYNTRFDDQWRRNPLILGPEKFQTDLVQGPGRTYMISWEDNKIAVLQRKEATKPGSPRPRFPNSNFRKLLAGPGQKPGMVGSQAKILLRDQELKFEDLDKVPDSAKLAEDIEPYRMVVVTANFPYRRQLDLFRRELRFRSLEESTKAPDGVPQFQGFEVKRRTLFPDGKKVKEDWADLDLQETFKRIRAEAVDFEQDDPKLKPLIFPGLAMPRPKLARGQYPELKLESISETLQELENANKSGVTVPLSTFARRLTSDISVFDPNAGNESRGAMPGDPMRQMPTPGFQPGYNPMALGNLEQRSATPELFVPEFCLLRFIDVTVKPGFVYEYKIRVKVTNPNFGKEKLVAYPSLAIDKELKGDEVLVPPVVVPSETLFYALDRTVDQTTRTRKYAAEYSDLTRGATFVQVHRWLEKEKLNPANKEPDPIGDWTVAEMPAYRGEYIGREESVEVPMWFPTKEAFDFAVPPRTKPTPGLLFPQPQAKGVPVYFGTNALLVDFEGGKQGASPRADEVDLEMLVWTADGKLVVRHSQVDVNDKEREERVKARQTWLEEVKTKKSQPKGPLNPFGQPTTRPNS